MNKEIRTTLIFGILSGLFTALFYSHLQFSYLGWSVGWKVFVFSNLSIYSVFLCRWSGTAPSAIFFPLLLCLGAAIWPGSHSGFVAIALGVFGWIRSGICFPDTLLKSIIAEAVTLGGAGCAFIWLPNAPLALPLSILLFFLFQSLYFYLVPSNVTEEQQPPTKDAFERARREAERLLDGS